MERPNIQRGLDVYDSSGTKMGTVGEVFDTYFHMDTGFLGLGKDYYIPFSSVTRVTRNQVVLNLSKDRIDHMGFDQRPTGRVSGMGPTTGVSAGTEKPPVTPEVRPPAPRETREDLGVQGERHMRLREEELEAHRHTEKVGEVDVTKEVVEERRHMSVPYTEERVHIERRPVHDGDAGGPVGEGIEEIRIPVNEEVIEVTKHPVTREEIVISKEKVTREKSIDETVRREVPKIRKEGDANLDTSDFDLTDEQRRLRDEQKGPNIKP